LVGRNKFPLLAWLPTLARSSAQPIFGKMRLVAPNLILIGVIVHNSLGRDQKSATA